MGRVYDRGVGNLRTGIVLFCLAVPAFAEQITLDVVVTSKSDKSHPVSGLQQDDFTIVDNKVPEKIFSFKAVQGGASEPPVEVVLLIDRVNTAFGSSADVRGQVKKFLGTNEGKLNYPVSMVFFSDSGTETLNATRDANVLIEALDKSDAGLRSVNRSQGIYGAADRFQLSLRAVMGVAALEEQKPGRKMLIWISPGWPALTSPRIQLTSKDKQQLFTGIVDASTALRKARVTLYSIDPLGVSDAGGFRTTFYEGYLKGVKNFSQAQAENLSLQVLSSQSGGRVLNSGNDIAAQIAECVADLSVYYVLTFDAPRADAPNEYHALEVKIGKPGLMARTRTGYYDQP